MSIRVSQQVSMKIPFIILISCSILLAFGLPVSGQQASSFRENTSLYLIEERENPASTLFLPTVKANDPWITPFGTESNLPWLADTNIIKKGVNLKVGWTRMGARISWRSLQPKEGDSIDWSKLSEFEREIKSLKAAGITPVVIIGDSPLWATVAPTTCAAIRADKFPAFERFVRELVNRYKDPEFNIHNWELGNEPDVDPYIVKPNNVFGCWGDVEDKYYGGEHYGEMLKVIGPVIKESDPLSKIWFGGLLLASPNTTIPGLGKPEKFLKGALEAGAGPYFDVLPYHWYPGYREQKVDHDLLGYWKDYGGGTIGKAKYLRELMAEYGVNKPLVMNEANLMCVSRTNCDPPDSDFFEMQANHIVRSFVRGLSEGVAGFSVYTLNGPGWRHTGLIDEAGNPRPAYLAYRELIRQLDRTRYSRKVDTFNGVEAYAFISGTQDVIVAWSNEVDQSKIILPQQKFVKAISRNGTPIDANLVDDSYEITVGFEPVYIVLLRN